MDKLRSLTPVVTPEAETQASSICTLMEAAVKENKSSVTFTLSQPYTSIHPLVKHVLVGKGYKVIDVTGKLAITCSAAAVYGCKTYLIYL